MHQKDILKIRTVSTQTEVKNSRICDMEDYLAHVVKNACNVSGAVSNEEVFPWSNLR